MLKLLAEICKKDLLWVVTAVPALVVFFSLSGRKDNNWIHGPEILMRKSAAGRCKM